MWADKESLGTLPLPRLPRYLVEATGLFKGDGVREGGITSFYECLTICSSHIHSDR